MNETLTNVKTKFTPRDYQVPIVEAIINQCKKSDSPFIFDITVGGGKSALYAFIADHVAQRGGKALILARQGELTQQNSDFGWKAQVKNSIYSASLSRKSVHYPVIYGTEGTIARALGEGKDFGYRLDKNTGEVIFNWLPDVIMIDEVDMVDYNNPESQYMKIINFFKKANPKLRILGGTGSPFRGKEGIIGDYWKKCVYRLPTETLIKWGWLVPFEFGFADDNHAYDFSSIEVDKDNDSFSDDDLNKIVLENPTKTQEIMLEVQDKCKSRLGVIVFCSTKKHCAEAVKALPVGSYGIVTDSTPNKERMQILKDSRAGKIKYLVNVSVCSVGYNNPRIDTIVYLRPLDSLRLLIQTIGRGLRIPEEDDYFKKDNCLVLDYAGVFDRLGALYENPTLEKAQAQKGRERGEVLICPRCNTENSLFARRCIGADELDNRCEHFWLSRVCEDRHINKLPVNGCGVENDPCARDCRGCGGMLIDPNEKLLRQHYTEDDLINVLSMTIHPCKNNGVLVVYKLEDGTEAKEFFSPFSQHRIAKRIWREKFVKIHCDQVSAKKVHAMRSAREISVSKNIKSPLRITHRINEKKQSVINRKEF